MKKKRFECFALFLALSLIFFVVLSNFAGAAGETVNMSSPITRGNYSTLVNVSIQSNLIVTVLANSYNVTLYCNKSGGSVVARAGVDIIKIITLTNSTPTAYLFENASVRVNSTVARVNESRIFNCSAYADNYTTQQWSNTLNLAASNVTFDNTPPNVSFSNIANTINNGNYSRLIVINASVIDSVIGVDRVYFNTTFSNGTQVNYSRAFNIGTGNFYNLSLNTSKLQDGRYNITVYANDTLNNFNKTERIYVTFDNTPPNVSSTLVGVVDNGNYSGLLNLNISANDALVGLSSAYFNITYPNGSQVSFSQATFSGGYYNASIDTNTLVDGSYNLTVQVNDTVNNVNNSAKFYLSFYNTLPIGGFSCSPSQVHKGNTVTCSCSGSSSAGISSYVYNPHPSTEQTGTFITSCIITDSMDNSITVSTTYSVERMSTTIKPKPIPSQAGSQTAEIKINKTQSWGKIIPGIVEIMKDFNVDIGVKQIEIEVKNEANNVEVSVIKYDSKPASVSVSKTNTYKYLQVKDENLEQSLDKAIMTIQVEKSWALANNLNKEDIALFKYDETSQTWSELKTTFKEEDSTYYYYDTELRGFSYFAIASKEIAPIGLWVWIVLSVIIVLILFFLVMKKTKLRKFFRLKK